MTRVFLTAVWFPGPGVCSSGSNALLTLPLGNPLTLPALTRAVRNTLYICGKKDDKIQLVPPGGVGWSCTGVQPGQEGRLKENYK